MARIAVSLYFHRHTCSFASPTSRRLRAPFRHLRLRTRRTHNHFMYSLTLPATCLVLRLGSFIPSFCLVCSHAHSGCTWHCAHTFALLVRYHALPTPAARVTHAPSRTPSALLTWFASFAITVHWVHIRLFPAGLRIPFLRYGSFTHFRLHHNRARRAAGWFLLVAHPA